MPSDYGAGGLGQPPRHQILQNISQCNITVILDGPSSRHKITPRDLRTERGVVSTMGNHQRRHDDERAIPRHRDARIGGEEQTAGIHGRTSRPDAARWPRQSLLPTQDGSAAQHQDRQVAPHHRSSPSQVRRCARRAEHLSRPVARSDKWQRVATSWLTKLVRRPSSRYRHSEYSQAIAASFPALP